MSVGLLKSASTTALFAAVGLLVGGVAMPSAKAADLGGDCCADLEERVAELEATTARKGNRRVSLTVSGQVNRSMLYWNDGFQRDIYSTDNAIGNSRFRLGGSARINPSLEAGFLFEIDLSIGARSHQVSQVDDDGVGSPLTALSDGLGGAGDSLPGITQANWYLAHKEIGRLTVGKANTTTSGIGIIDVSNTGVIANAQAFNWGGGMLLRNGAGVLGAKTWGQQNCGSPGTSGGSYSSDCGQHATSRRDAIMYTTPTWAGFSAGVSFGENDFWDTGLRYAGEAAGFRVAAGVGYRSYKDQETDALNATNTGALDNTDRRMLLASASAMHVPSGLFVSGSYYRYEFRGTNAGELINGLLANGNRPDVVAWYVNGGIQQNWTGLGPTTFYGEYGKTTDGVTGLATADAMGGAGFGTGIVVDSELTFYGFGAVQNISAAAMDLYIGYRRYSTDVTTSLVQVTGGLEDIWYVQAGARIQF